MRAMPRLKQSILPTMGHFGIIERISFIADCKAIKLMWLISTGGAHWLHSKLQIA